MCKGIGCFSHTRNRAPSPQPRHVPWPGIEPATFLFVARHPAHWAKAFGAEWGVLENSRFSLSLSRSSKTVYQICFRRDSCIGWQVGLNAFQGLFKELQTVSLRFSRVSNRKLHYMLISFLNMNLWTSVHTLMYKLFEYAFMLMVMNFLRTLEAQENDFPYGVVFFYSLSWQWL